MLLRSKPNVITYDCSWFDGCGIGYCWVNWYSICFILRSLEINMNLNHTCRMVTNTAELSNEFTGTNDNILI